MVAVEGPKSRGQRGVGVRPLAALAAGASPAVSGAPRDGALLSVQLPAPSAPANGGFVPEGARYQWLRCDAKGTACSAISGATGPEYTAGPLDVGQALRATVKNATPGSSPVETTASAVIEPAAPSVALLPRVMGARSAGSTLTAVAELWFGTPPFSLSYQWLRCDATGSLCTPIAGETEATHLVSAADAAGSVAVEVQAKNAVGTGVARSKPFGFSAQASTLATCFQTPTVVSSPTTSPTGSVVSGTAISIASSGTWSPAYGTCANSQFRYAWFRDGGLVIDQGTSTAAYTTGSADQGHLIALQVTYEYTTDVYHGWSARAADVSVTAPPNQAPLKPTEQAFPVNEVIADPSGPIRIKYSDPDGDTGQLQYRLYGTSGAVQQTYTLTNIVSGDYPNWFLATAPQVGQVSWEATPTDNHGLSGPISDRYYFWYTNVPATPTLLSPVSAAVVSNPSPVLRAQSTDPENDPVGFTFIVATDSACGNAVATSPLVASWKNPSNQYEATWQVPEGKLADNTTYYWCAKATDLHVTSGNADSAKSAGRPMTVKIPSLGSRSYWPMWNRGPVAVNLANGNAVVSLPGPSYPTGIGNLEASVTYNTLDTKAALFGLGQRWTLGTIGNVPAKLLDHNQYAAGNEQYDGLERVSADGSSDYYAHVGSSTTYQPGAGDASLLVKNQDGTWTLTDPDGSLYTFDSAVQADKSYKLTAAEVSVGSSGAATFAYAYDGSGRVTAIAAKQGTSTIATLTFDWGCATRGANGLLCVIGPDGRAWKYIGDGGGGTSGKLLQAKLISADQTVTRPLVTLTYGATSGRVESLQNANDLSPTDPNLSAQYRTTHKLQVAYDANGKVTSVTEGPIRDREGASPTDRTPTWTLTYTCTPGLTLPTPAATHTGVSWPASASGCTELKPPNQQPSGTKVARVWYDVLRQPLKTTDIVDYVNGTYTLSRYSDSHLLAWTEDKDGRPTDYTYDPVDGTLLSTVAPDPDGAGSLGRPTTSYRYDETKIGTATTPGAALQGLRASYFNGSSLAGRPIAVRNDASIDATWTGAPATGVNADNFSVRWSGNLNVTAASDTTYVFSTLAGGGSRLVIDGVQAIDKWTGQTTAAAECSPPIRLTPGKHRIAVEFHDTGSGTADVHLRWTTNSNCTAGAVVIPTGNLLPAWLNQTSVVAARNTDGGAARVSFAHFNQPWTGLPDYTLVPVGATNHVTSFDYDSYGRTLTKWLPKANQSRNPDANGDLPATPAPDTNYRTQFAYYTPTETASVDSGCGTSSAVLQAGMLKSLTDSGLTARTTVYDTGARPLSARSAKGVVCKSYDKEGRLTSENAITGVTGITTTYFYEPIGLLAKATDPNGSVITERNEAGAPIKITDSYGAVEKDVYDLEGNATSRTLIMPAGSPSYATSYTYNEANQLTGQTDPAGRAYAFFYDTRGNPVGANYPTSTATSSFRTLNPTGWVDSLVNRHGTLTTPGGKIAGTAPSTAPADSNPLSDYSYVYFQNGQRKSEQRKVGTPSALTTSYGYDDMGRLETVTYADGSTRRICFDRNSNRTEVQAAASGTPPACGTANPLSALTYNPATTPGLDELTTLAQTGQASRSYTYNNDGDTTARGADTFSWDVRNRLTTGSFNNQTVSYEYDAAGFRRKRTAAVNYQGSVLADLPFTYWRLGETSGTTAYDKAGLINAAHQTGTTVNQTGALTASGDSDKSVSYNGSSGYTVAATPVKFGSAPFTVEAWFKTSASTANQVIYFAGAGQTACGNGKVLLRTTATGKLRYFIEDGSSGNNAWIETGVSVANGVWHHAVATRSGTGATTVITLYLDGAYVNSYTTASYPISSVDAATAPVSQIGSFYPCNSSVGYAYLNGQIDEVALYRYALTASQVAEHYARASQSSASRVTKSLLGGLIETDNAGTTITGFDIDSLVGDLAHYTAAPTSGQTAVKFAYYNAHGDLASEANLDGSLYTSYAYSPFGQQSEGLVYNTATTSERYTAGWDKKIDPASLTIEMGARSYDPLTGRFLTTDPIEGGSLNSYDYAAQDPINNYDLDGQIPCGHDGCGGRGTQTAGERVTAPGTPTTPALRPATTFAPKILRQLPRRGWTQRLVQKTIDNPARTVRTRDIRGGANDPATAFYSGRGGYVVRNDRTGDIVQVSDRTNPGWKAPWNP